MNKLINVPLHETGTLDELEALLTELIVEKYGNPEGGDAGFDFVDLPMLTVRVKEFADAPSHDPHNHAASHEIEVDRHYLGDFCDHYLDCDFTDCPTRRDLHICVFVGERPTRIFARVKVEKQEATILQIEYSRIAWTLASLVTPTRRARAILIRSGSSDQHALLTWSEEPELPSGRKTAFSELRGTLSNNLDLRREDVICYDLGTTLSPKFEPETYPGSKLFELFETRCDVAFSDPWLRRRFRRKNEHEGMFGRLG